MTDEEADDRSSPSRIQSPELRAEASRALVWVSVIGLVVLAVYIAQPLLVVFGAMVFAAMIDGGARLLERVLPIPRGLRVGLVLLLTVAFFLWLGFFAGSQISREAAQLPSIVQAQVRDLLAWLNSRGIAIDQSQISSISGTVMSGVGTVTRAIGGIFGGLATIFLILIIGIYVALEPQLYERGVAWILPRNRRKEFHITADRMAYTMRRLMAGRLVGMVFEGIFTYILLAWYGVPMAALLAILTALLAFIPNLGAFVSGVLMVLVGFSGGVEMGLYTIFVYALVQAFDGYIIIPMIAKKTVDLAPALVLAAQLIMGILFGILGLFLADPLLAMIKVMLERRAERAEARETAIRDASPQAA
ncbi:AI-2E family transporter [Qipengyuania atrilutea]|uniref:AI-2E family transporter n=1 Tax=Qipengyuania atrilutea TaxID=2744473 RepID=A0A850HEG2_9SPHN|nr:AI-2E family transporter [Actirhodobacter atriluteus]NVD45609.1 AI-2E family transporter [Actirhodobacter atriluteus]